MLLPVFFGTESVSGFEAAVKIAGIIVSDSFNDIRHRENGMGQEIEGLLHLPLLQEVCEGLAGDLLDLTA